MVAMKTETRQLPSPCVTIYADTVIAMKRLGWCMDASLRKRTRRQGCKRAERGLSLSSSVRGVGGEGGPVHCKLTTMVTASWISRTTRMRASMCSSCSRTMGCVEYQMGLLGATTGSGVR